MITVTVMYFHKNIRLTSQTIPAKGPILSPSAATSAGHTSLILPDVNGCFPTSATSLLPTDSQFPYCVMPDHVHLLVDGLRAASDFLAFTKSLKLKTSREFAVASGNPLWQKKYFDHILRPKESMDAVPWYIWLNPVRAGLGRAAGIYPFVVVYDHDSQMLSLAPDVGAAV